MALLTDQAKAVLPEFTGKKSSLAYLLIWGHGLRYLREIFSCLEAQSFANILEVVRYRPWHIKHLVKHIYSYDYAPFYHLQSKVKYLLSTPNDVIFIFFEITDLELEFYGEGEYRHLEFKALKKFKEEIRDEYNPYLIGGARSEDHVIHVSDNESQVDYILKYLGYQKGVKTFKSNCLLGSIPNYIKVGGRYSVSTVGFESIFCNIFSEGPSGEIERARLEDSPHYTGLFDGFESYAQYLWRHLGDGLRSYYSVRKYSRLVKELQYLGPGYETHYIVVEAVPEGFVIQDGLHRASILKSRGEHNIKVLIV